MNQGIICSKVKPMQYFFVCDYFQTCILTACLFVVPELNMSNLKLIVLVLVLLKFKFVVSETCTSKYDCSNNKCCYYGFCIGSFLCPCSSDDQCSGCCVNSRCKPWYSSQCYDKKKTCYWNSDCNSRCCKNRKCQQSHVCRKTTTTSAPSFTTRKSCSYDYNCRYYPGYYDQCCIYGQCQSCSLKATTDTYQVTSAPTFTTTRKSCYDDYDCRYYKTDYDQCCRNGQCQYCLSRPTYTGTPKFNFIIPI